MAKVIKAELIVRQKKFGVVVSRFNDFISKRLLDGAVDTLLRHGAREQDIDIVWTPGCFEIPVVAKKLVLGKRKYDAVICLGAVIRGQTSHFEYIASEAAKGVASVSLDTGVPVIFGIITADSLEQAIERAGVKEGNKGVEAARNAIEMANLMILI